MFSLWFYGISEWLNSLSFPNGVVSFSGSKGTDLNAAIIEVIVSDRKVLTLLWGRYNDVPFLAGFGSDVVSDARGFECHISVLTVINRVSYHFGSCSKAIVIRLCNQVCFFKSRIIRLVLSLQAYPCGLPNCIWEFEGSESLIPD